MILVLNQSTNSTVFSKVRFPGSVKTVLSGDPLYKYSNLTSYRFWTCCGSTLNKSICIWVSKIISNPYSWSSDSLKGNFWKKSPTCFDVTEQTSKQWKTLWPSENILTLIRISIFLFLRLYEKTEIKEDFFWNWRDKRIQKQLQNVTNCINIVLWKYMKAFLYAYSCLHNTLCHIYV